jgi:hypothetical protein
MRHSIHLRRAAAIVGCSASLAGAALVAAPGAGAAPTAHSCGAKTIAVKTGGETTKVPASRIRVEGGATCAEAVKVIRGVVLHKIPRGWSVGRGGFKVPSGLTAHIAVNGHKKVKFALVGPG